MGRPLPTHQDAPRVYQRMLSGRLVHLLDPSPLDIDITDFVVGVSREPRWNGQIRGETSYCVLQHEVVVKDILIGMVWPHAPASVQLAAISHDHAEVLCKDFPTPQKLCIGPQGYYELEERIARAIRISIGLPATLPPLWHARIKKADRIAAVTEAVRLACWSLVDARRDVGKGYRGPLWEGPLEPWTEREARARWMEEYRRVRLLPEASPPSEKPPPQIGLPLSDPVLGVPLQPR